MSNFPTMEKNWLRPFWAVLALCGAAVHPALWASTVENARSSIERLLETQTAGLSGKVAITITPSSLAALPPCQSHEAFLPPGAAPWGKTFVGIRCQGERPWTRFVQVHVAVDGRYFVAASAIDAGKALSDSDFIEKTGDLTSFPRTLIVRQSELQRAVASNRIAAGTPMRRDLLRPTLVIQSGQTVQVTAHGQGFVISTAGQALTQAAAGGTVPVKTGDGRLFKGVARDDGTVEIAQ